MDKDDIMLGDILQLDETKREFLTQYYSAGDPPPKLIVIDEPFEDMELVEQYFTGLAGMCRLRHRSFPVPAGI